MADRARKPEPVDVQLVRRERKPCRRDRQLFELLVDLLDKPDHSGQPSES